MKFNFQQLGFSLLIALLFFMFSSCNESKEVDLIVHNAIVYTVNSQFEKASSFAIKDGVFIDVGGEEILEKYKSNNMIDCKGMFVYPGFIDSHCHFLEYGLSKNHADLKGAKSFDEVLIRLKEYAKNKFIIGRGWDQNLWINKDFPDKRKLDEIFPNIPVVLERIDGHAYLVNQVALDLAGINLNTEVKGGKIIKKNNVLSGLLVDTAMSLIKAIIPDYTVEVKIQALKEAEKEAFKYGLTTLNEAGLDLKDFTLIDSLQRSGDLSIKVYGMVNYSKNSLDYFLEKGLFQTNNLTVRSFKVFLDGALGSRGASLKKAYSDKRDEYGNLNFSIEEFEELCFRIAKSGFQLNTHAIGDKANSIVLNSYRKALRGVNDPRWRIEHAQVISKEDFKLINSKIIPSIQPTQAISDMKWSKERVGKERIVYSYAYKDLLDWGGKIVLGSDFPVEVMNPLITFYSAVSRKNLKGFPEDGFQIKNKLSRSEALKGMTSWAAFANFEDSRKGSISIGKYADFVILKNDIMTIDERYIPNVKVVATIINGKLVYSIN
mgnify:CR=1 FL=1